uniref:Uncharacterized protein n=1 Tax=viral metagenome TaxID=1070528 RepID=A0A6C0LXE0_9ZZZZ
MINDNKKKFDKKKNRILRLNVKNDTFLAKKRKKKVRKK